jgi:hypothetical protein
MPRVGFEPKIPLFERTKAVHALDGAATVIGFVHATNVKLTRMCLYISNFLFFYLSLFCRLGRWVWNIVYEYESSRKIDLKPQSHVHHVETSVVSRNEHT